MNVELAELRRTWPEELSPQVQQDLVEYDLWFRGEGRAITCPARKSFSNEFLHRN